MTERRFFVNQIDSDFVVLADDEYNHLRNVLRLQPNDKVTLVCGDGFDYHGTICEVTKKNATIKIIEKVKNNNDAKLNLTLFLGLVKNDSFSSIVTRMSELGVKKIVPFNSEYNDIKLQAINIEKMQKVANMAIKQCDMSTPTKVEHICTFENMLVDLKNYDSVYFAYEGQKNNQQKITVEGNNIAVVIGPIGGFSTSEAEKLSNLSNCKVTSLGRRIMRVETACASLVSVLMHLSGEWEI